MKTTEKDGEYVKSDVAADLLEACEEMLLHCAFQNEKAWKAAAKARAAIAKARKEV